MSVIDLDKKRPRRTISIELTPEDIDVIIDSLAAGAAMDEITYEQALSIIDKISAAEDAA